MNADEYRKLERIFHAIVDHPTEARHGLLEQYCGSDLELRAEVERLLRATENTMGKFMHVADGDAASFFDHTPERIGQYRIRRLIASGGMGSVYEAEQENPRRAVALKIMKGIASRSALQRFEYESQVLARLRHAGIAQVFEAGTHQEGRSTVPYFAMEFIPEAQRITEFANARKLGIRERLRLILQVCNAVHHGHQKGIIHRDLKPANILVDAQGDVKVIDFGIARDNDADLAITRVQTGEGQLIGTLQYMSPEQVNADPNDVDVRSDVYALGLILFELICGQRPYDIRDASVFDALRIIREQPPPKPRSISSAVQDDLETITLKAIEKDRDRRYQSADELGVDIQRYLSGEPISARPPSLGYQLRVLARRNKIAFVSIITGFVILVAASIFSTWQYFLADAARADAVAAGNEAEQRREAEERQRKKAEAITELVTRALVSSDPREGGTQGFLVVDAMQKAIASLDAGELKDHPETEADMLLTISKILTRNGKTPEALRLAQKALELNTTLHFGDHPDVATNLNDLAVCLQAVGRTTEALAQHQLALEMNQRLFEGDHREVALSLNNVGNCMQTLGRLDEALPKFEASLEMWRRLFQGDDPDIAYGMTRVALCQQYLGHPKEALPKHEAALEMFQRLNGGDHPDVAASLINVGGCLYALGRYAEALPKFESGLEMEQRLFEGAHPSVATGLNDVAACLHSLGRVAEALPKYEAAMEMQRQLYEQDHPDISTSLNNIADCLKSLGRTAEALPRYEAALEMQRRLFEGDHPATAMALSKLASCTASLGRSEKALARHEAALEMYQRIFEDDHPDVAACLNDVAFCFHSLGRSEEALLRFEAALQMRQRLFEGDHPHVARSLGNLAACLRSLGRSTEALPISQAALEMYQRLFEGDHPDVARSLVSVAACLNSLDRPAEALPLIESALAMLQRLYTGDHPLSAHALTNLGTTLESLGRSEESAARLQEALEMSRHLLPDDHPRLAYPQVGLATSLISLGRFAEADALLDEVAEQCERSPASKRMHWSAVVNASIRLYSAWQLADPTTNRQSEVDSWQAELRELRSD